MGAFRLPTLPAAVVPVIVGSAIAVAHHPFRPLTFVATLVASLLIQIGTNLSNDYYDFRKGADTADRIGPSRITAGGNVRPRDVLVGAALAFLGAAVLGVYLISIGGWPILLVGIASILAAVGYTGGPYPLGYHGLGDIFTFLFFGVIAVCGTYYLQTGGLSFGAVLASIPVGFLVTAILVVNNVRDADSDRATGKMTLAARFGRGPSRVEYCLLVLGSYLFPFLMVIQGSTVWWLFWLPLLTIPLAIRLLRTVLTHVDGPALNRALAGTGRLHLLFGCLLAVSLLK